MSSYTFLAPLPEAPRGRTTERVERAIKDALVRLDFAPGEFIDKLLVCERLGVSRFPVSEAFGRLASEGLVEILPQRGTRAARIRLGEVREAMLIRRALEGAIAENAARDLSEEALAEIQRNMREQEEAVAAGDRDRFYALDFDFHDILVTDQKLFRVRAVIEASRANIDRVRRLLDSPRRQADTLAEHRVIMAGLAARRPSQARAAMESHLDNVMAELIAFSTERPEVFEDAPAGEAA